MKKTIAIQSVLVVVAFLLAASAGTALSADPLCPMGGAMVVADADKGKALAWAADLSKKAIGGEDSADWSVLTLSRTSADIAILVTPGYVFFGVAGRGGETYPRDIEKAFGKDFRKLKEAVRREAADLDQAGAIKLSGNEVQQLADNAGLGVLEKSGSTWALTTRGCQAVDLPASGL